MSSISSTAEQALLGNTNFDRGHMDRVVAEAKQNLGQFQHRDGPGAKKYEESIKTLEGLRPSNANPLNWTGGLSQGERDKIRGAVQDVGGARMHAQRENLPNDQYTRRAGDDPGIYRNRDDGEVARRDPGARTDLEKRTVNPAERGIARDADTQRVVHRDPGAKTGLEKADEQGEYAKSGRKTYRPGATSDQVNGDSRIFREGDKDVNGGDGIKKLQQAMRAAGYNPGRADGYYGPQTAAAAKKFFDDNKILSGNFGQTEMRMLQQAADRRRVQPRPGA